LLLTHDVGSILNLRRLIKVHNKNAVYEVVSPIDVIHGVLAREISQCNDGLTLAGVDHSITCMREDIVDALKLVEDCFCLLVEMDNDWHPSVFCVEVQGLVTRMRIGPA
jgi:hypothetical protein